MMIALPQHQEVCRYFAALFSYPDDQVEAQATACALQLQGLGGESATLMESFVDFLKTSDASRVAEAFTGAFDLQALCHPYVGYQLCGESQQRTMFMIKLRELYGHYGFSPGNDLPDHLGEVLRFISSITDQDCRLEIIRDGLLPALVKMSQGLTAESHPYLQLIKSLQSFLTETACGDSERLAADRQKECLP